MRPEIERLILEEPRIIAVGPPDDKGGIWVDYERGTHHHVRIAEFKNVLRSVLYTTPGKRGCRTMPLQDFLLWGLDGEYSDGTSADDS